MRINKAHAEDILRAEAAEATEAGKLSRSWIEKIEALSRLCEKGISKTHIAFLGTAMLAKSVNTKVDLIAIKPSHAKENPHSFSARGLCHSVLVPLSAELGISLGVSGREPLNNQPYFRMTRLDDGTPVHKKGKEAFNYMFSLVQKLGSMPNEIEARNALRAFIAVRRKYQSRYVDYDGEKMIMPENLLGAIEKLVHENGEGGKCAQAIVAGLIDTFAGPHRTKSGRINDPSRKHPGDICVASQSDPSQWEKAIEVRDKPVSVSDIQIFGKKCVDMGVQEAALVMVSDQQKQLNDAALAKWADSFGIGLTLFYGWENLVDQVLYWSELPKPVGASRAIGFIHQRLISIEASPETVTLWQQLT